MFTALLRRAELHGGPRGVPHRAAGIRTGLTKVGFPGATDGYEPAGPVHRRAAQALGYATGQFGKNHVGDRNELLPTVNGFDEFFGNLYHLNAEEEPECRDYPKDPAYRAKFGPRGVLRCGRRIATTRRPSALGPDRQADHRGHRPAHPEAHGDDRRRDVGGRHRLHEAAARRGQAVLLLVQRDPHASAHACRAEAIAAATSTGTANTSTAWSSTTRWSARSSRRSTTWASPTTPSWSTPATTART